MRYCPLVLLFALFFFPALAHGQTIWAYDSINYTTSDRWLRFNAEDCSVEDTRTTTNFLATKGLAIPGNDSLAVYYKGLTADIILSGEGLYSLPLSNYVSFYEYAGPLPDTLVQAMACDYDGLVYAAGSQLSTYDYTTRQIVSLGSFPDGMRAGGGLTYRGGRLYMTTLQNELVLINVDAPEQSMVVHTFPDSIGLVQGMATFPYRCDSMATYVVVNLEDRQAQIYRLDFDDYSLTLSCEIEGHFLDIASETERVLPPCELYIDLDKDRSSGAPERDFRRTTCTGPVPIADEDAEVFSPLVLDSMRIELASAPDGADEQLYCTGAAGIGVQGNGTGSLLLYSTAWAGGEAFTEALLATFYENTSAMPALGERQIVVRMYSSFYSSLPSISTIVLDTLNHLKLGTDTAAAACHGQPALGAALEGRNGVAPYAFLWPDGQSAAQRSDLGAGAYAIAIRDAQGCTGQDTLRIGQPDSLLAAIAVEDTLACAGAGQLSGSGSGGVPPYGFEWSDGQSGEEISGLDAGVYVLSVTDANGCAATAVAELVQADTFLNVATAAPCAGQPYLWQGQTFTADTSLCYVYSSQQGCDSTYCLELAFVDRSARRSAAACPGEAYRFGGQDLFLPGTYRDTISDGQPCDSIVVLELSNYPPSDFSLAQAGSLCQGGTALLQASGNGAFLWSDGSTGPSLPATAPGTYALTFTDANGCTATDSLVVAANTLAFAFSAGHPDCAVPGQGFVQVDSTWGGLPPYRYRLSGGPLQGSARFEGLAAGPYELQVEDAAGCWASAPLLLPPPDELLLSLPEDRTIRLGESVALAAEVNRPDFRIEWRPAEGLSCADCPAPAAQPERSQVYTALVTDSLGCTVSGEVAVLVDARARVYLPTAFSPNGDGRNDTFTAYADGSVAELLSLDIYDRWGGKVFAREGFAPNSPALGWDGSARGGPAPAATYVYRLRYRLLDGREEVVSGEVLLVR